jgi:hypothetical protein
MACPDDVTRMADMSEKIAQLNAYLRRPIYQDRVNAALRVVFPSTPNVAIASGTVDTLTSKAGINLLTTELRWEMKDRWQNGCRRMIT